MSAPWNPVPGWDVPRSYYAPDEPTAEEDSFDEMAEERMAFKPYCPVCASWHTEEEGHVGLWCHIDEAECFSPDCREHGCMWTSENQLRAKCVKAVVEKNEAITDLAEVRSVLREYLDADEAVQKSYGNRDEHDRALNRLIEAQKLARATLGLTGGQPALTGRERS